MHIQTFCTLARDKIYTHIYIQCIYIASSYSCCVLGGHCFIQCTLQNNSRFWPGLGGTDTDYAWTLAASSFFELFSVPLALFLTHRCPFRITLVIGPLISAAGGAVYALAVNVWMIFLGRGMCGLSAGLCVPILHTYIGEMGTVMDDIKKKRGKKPRKFTLYIAHSFIMNGGFLVAFGKSV